MRRRILVQLFDIRPLRDNRIHWEWVARVTPVLNLRGEMAVFQGRGRDRFVILQPRGFPQERFALIIRSTGGSYLSEYREPTSKVTLPKTPTASPYRYDTKRQRTARRFFVIGMAVAMAGFLVWAAWGTITLRNDVSHRASYAAVLLEQGLKDSIEGNFPSAIRAFDEANATFIRAQNEVAATPWLLRTAVNVSPYRSSFRSGKALVSVGVEVSAAARAMAGLAGEYSDPNVSTLLLPKSNDVERRDTFEQTLSEAGEHLDRARGFLSEVNPDALPRDVAPRVRQMKKLLPELLDRFGSSKEALDAMFSVLGFHERREYIVLLQNASELRPTGGFAGNIGRVTLQNGHIESFTIQDAYDLDGQIVDHTVPPKPIQDISTAWSLHDSNWFRDYPTTAPIAAAFFTDVTGITPDGVFAVSSTLLPDILSVVGPQIISSGAQFKDSNVIDALNRLGVIQKKGDTLEARTMQELANVLLARLAKVTPEEQEKLARILISRAKANDILAWFPDPREQALSESMGLAGGLSKDEADNALAIVHANINGFKTDAVIQESVAVDVEVTVGGEIINTVTIRRHHTWKNRTDALYGKVNKDYVRLYVPKDAQLLSVSGTTPDPYTPPVDYNAVGFRTNPTVVEVESSEHMHQPDGTSVFEEAGHTVFGAWLFVSPGETIEATFRYTIPRRIDIKGGETVFFLEKQPGWEPDVVVRIHAPEGSLAASSDARQREGILEVFNGRLTSFASLRFSVVHR